MVRVGVHEAKTRLSELLRRVSAGEEILIMRGRVPVARVVPVKARVERRLGTERGRLVIPKSFDAPLPDSVLDDFER